MSNKFLKSTIALLSLIYLIVDIGFFIIEKVRYDFVVLEYSYPPSYEIVLRWNTALVFISFYFKNIVSMKPLTLILSITIILKFIWDFYNGNIFYGSFVYLIRLLEIISFITLMSSLYSSYKKWGNGS